MKFSIIIPTYNASEFLEFTLQDLVNFTNGDFEILLGFKNATPEVKEVADKFSRKYRYIKKMRTSSDEVYQKINELVKLSSNEKVVFLNDDMAFSPDWNVDLVSRIRKDTFVVAQVFDSNYLNDGIEAGNHPKEFNREYFYSKIKEYQRRKIKTRFFPMPLGFMKADFLEVGGYPNSNYFPYPNDLEFLNKLGMLNKKFDFAENSFVYHFIRGSQREDNLGLTY